METKEPDNNMEDIILEELHFSKDRGFNMSLSHPIFSKLLDELCIFFEKSGAMNYVEFSMMSTKYGPMDVIIQRHEGLTPAQKNIELIKEIEDLKNKLKDHGIETSND